ncbi:MAG: Phosphoglycerol transferase I [Phycisphaerae bacterium]|nr:Phosphoglycerol transferase I [Phycisphaerae bacterium]
MTRSSTVMMRLTLRRLARLKLVHLSFCTLLVLIVQAAFMAVFILDPRFTDIRAMSPLRLVGWILTNFVVVILYFQIVGLLLMRLPWALRVVNCISVILFAGLFAYHYHRATQLDYSMLRNNGSEIFYSESLRMIFDHVQPVGLWAVYGGLLAGVFYLALGTRLMRHWPRPAYYLPTLIVSTAIWAGVVALPVSADNDVTFFLRSTIDCVLLDGDLPDVPQRYPYVRQAADDIPLADQNPDRPHVFIILMESFNAQWAYATDDRQREYTPNFNAFARRSFSVRHFYGNSMQTSRGQLATLASIIPSMYRKFSERYYANHLHALPAILASRGYQTNFFQGYAKLNFDNTLPFIKALGFQEIHAMNEEFGIHPDRPRPDVWGWGVQDDTLYRNFFTWLDGQHDAAVAAGRDPRYFSVISTITNHMMFCDIPPDQQYLYPGAEDTRLRMANSAYLCDKYLGEFFAQFKSRPWLANSIIVITADHSYPAGNHRGNFHNEWGFYEETFHTPLAISWPGHLDPRCIQDVAYSQLDIAPTILDLMKIREPNHFLGRSMLAGDAAPPRPVPLVQPYEPMYLCAVEWPYKYVRQINRGGAELLFDLDADPMERHNLFEAHRDSDLVARLRSAVRGIRLNQRLIQENRIWPGN